MENQITSPFVASKEAAENTILELSPLKGISVRVRFTIAATILGIFFIFLLISAISGGSPSDFLTPLVFVFIILGVISVFVF